MTGHFFYGFLDGKIPGTDALSVASKVRRPCQAKLKMPKCHHPLRGAGGDFADCLRPGTVVEARVFEVLMAFVVCDCVLGEQVGIDQLLWNPIFGCMFFGYLGLCEGQDFNGIKTKIQNDLVTAVSHPFIGGEND